MRNFKIWSNGLLLGSLSLDQRGGSAFAYSTWWVENRPNLHLSARLPVQLEAYRGDSVFVYFDNLLPDSDRTRRALASRYSVSDRVEDLITVIGRDCIGAIQILPEEYPDPILGAPTGTPLNDDDIERSLQECLHNDAGYVGDDFRISLAGAHKKMALLFNNEQWMTPLGSTPTTHIFKLPIGPFISGGEVYDFSGSVANEHFCLRVLSHLGLNAAESRMAKFKDQRALVVKRFDRRWQSGACIRIFQEDFCQVLGFPSSQKYEHVNVDNTRQGPGCNQIMDFLKDSLIQSDRLSFLKAQVLNVILAGADGHAKNYSILRSTRGFILAPFYDVVSFHGIAQSHPSCPERLNLAFKLNDAPSNLFRISRSHILNYAKRNRDEADQIEVFMDSLPALLPVALSSVRSQMTDLTEGEKTEVEAIVSGSLNRLESFLAL